jgi:hypothetical protein
MGFGGLRCASGTSIVARRLPNDSSTAGARGV